MEDLILYFKLLSVVLGCVEQAVDLIKKLSVKKENPAN
jgi:hypothetical protein